MLTDNIDKVVESIKDTKEKIDSLLQVQSMIDQKPFSRDAYRLEQLKLIASCLDDKLKHLIS